MPKSSMLAKRTVVFTTEKNLLKHGSGILQNHTNWKTGFHSKLKRRLKNNSKDKKQKQERRSEVGKNRCKL